MQACKEIRFQVSKEALGYFSDSNNLPGDLTIHGYETNLDLLVDLTVVSSPQNVEKAANSGCNAQQTEKMIIEKYRNELT